MYKHPVAMFRSGALSQERSPAEAQDRVQLGIKYCSAVSRVLILSVAEKRYSYRYDSRQ